MTRPTIKQRLDYKQIILDCQIRRFTDKETLEYFHINRISDISLPTIKRYKTQIRHGAQKWIASLAVSKRADRKLFHKKSYNFIKTRRFHNHIERILLEYDIVEGVQFS